MIPNSFFVLIVDPDPASSEAWRVAVPLAKMDRQVYGVQSATQAIEYVLKVRRSPSLSTPGVVMVQSNRSLESLSVIGHWLRTQENLCWVAPIALVDARGRDDFAEYYAAGARSCLPSPECIEERVSVLSEVRKYWQGLNVWPNPERYG